MRGTGPLLLVLSLAACGKLVTALRCYTCHTPMGVSSCTTTTECNANETICKTTFYSLEIVYPVPEYATVTKSCSNKCESSGEDGIGETRPVSCCNTDLCNVDRAPALGGACPLALAFALALALAHLMGLGI